MALSAARVTGLGVYLPHARTTAGEIALASGLPEAVVRDKLGIRSKPAPSSSDQPTRMGVAAARSALTDAGVRATDVDVVICMTDEYKEYPVWTSGIKLAHDLGATRAYAFDVGQKCGTGVLGLKLARDLIAADPDVGTVLVAGGYRNGDLVDYTDPDVRFLYNLGAGGGAALVQRTTRGGHSVLGASFITDGSLAEAVLVPVGGTKSPITADNLAEFRLQVHNPSHMRNRLGERSLDNFMMVIREAVERSGADLGDIRYLALLHMKRSAHEQVLKLLDLPPERSIYLNEYGHMGQVDQIMSLMLARETGRLCRGDLVVLVAAGIGYVWNAICLRWESA